MRHDILVDESDEFAVDDDGSNYVVATVVWPTNEFGERVTVTISPGAVREMMALVERNK